MGCVVGLVAYLLLITVVKAVCGSASLQESVVIITELTLAVCSCFINICRKENYRIDCSRKDAPDTQRLG